MAQDVQKHALGLTEKLMEIRMADESTTKNVVELKVLSIRDNSKIKLTPRQAEVVRAYLCVEPEKRDILEGLILQSAKREKNLNNIVKLFS